MRKFKIEYTISEEAFDVLEKLEKLGFAEFRDSEFESLEAYSKSLKFEEEHIKKDKIERFKRRNFGGTLKYINELAKLYLVELNLDSWHQTWYITKLGRKILTIA